MTNHVHLVAIPRRATSLALAIGQTHWHYTMRFNQKYRRRGHLWQNRFYSCPLGPTHLVTALAYVDLNPVRAGMVGLAGQYPWSSAAAHGSGDAEDGLIDAWAWSEIGLQGDWGERLAGESRGDRNPELQRATESGLPFGDKKFVGDMEVRPGAEAASEAAGARAGRAQPGCGGRLRRFHACHRSPSPPGSSPARWLPTSSAKQGHPAMIRAGSQNFTAKPRYISFIGELGSSAPRGAYQGGQQ